MFKLIFCFVLLGQLKVLAVEILPDVLYATPVLIQIPLADQTHQECGSGVYIQESNKVFLVTAAHCIFDFSNTNRFALINSNAVFSSFVRGDMTNKNVLLCNLLEVMGRAGIKRHMSHDVAVLYLGPMELPTTNGTIRGHLLAGLKRASGDTPWSFGFTGVCLTFTNVFDGDETYILGYPVELFKNYDPAEIDFSYPLIRKGIVAQKNRLTGKLILDSGVYGGNSGGPVIIVRQTSPSITDYKIAGLITQFVPVSTKVIPEAGFTNSVLVNTGYGVAEPIDYALELMREFETAAEQTNSLHP